MDVTEYAESLRDGNVILLAWNGLQKRLRTGFPEDKFSHFIVPPGATRQTWTEILSPDQSIAVAFAGWKPDKNTGPLFRGDLVFDVFAIVRMSRSRDLYLGTGQLRGTGVFGMTAILTAMLHAYVVPGVGSSVIRDVSLPQAAEWLDGRQAIVGVQVVFPDVALDDVGLVAQADDFLRLGETWTINDEKLEPDVLAVRGS